MNTIYHPISIIYDLIESLGEDYTFKFSKYFYRPQNPLDEREIFSVIGAEINDDWLEKQIGQLSPGWELALNSEVVDPRNRRYHMPMIDFYGRETDFLFSPYFRSMVGGRFHSSMSIFDSGRSYHAYSPMLMSNKEWIGFMGALLLLTLPNSPPVVDARWVGHRLIGGYSALRWSCNSANYLQYPELVPLSTIIPGRK
ncbi:hypothetical protein [Dyella sp. S184]|uniref:primase 1D-like protein n=1 Tax=Dyella sp. S184 TaxID=1641862 RepID=UPI00131BAF4C|nr:hypothetical protein [Dyella sp. S184]